MASKGLINEEEKDLCRQCMRYAMDGGAGAIRVSMSKSIQNSISVLDGQIDKITYNEDRSLFFHIFAQGRYGTFSTNRLETNELEAFLDQAVATTLLMAPDPFRCLPDPSHKATECTQGDELDLVDGEYFKIEQQAKIDIALKAASIATKHPDVNEPQYSIESVESEYSDSYDDNYMIDSEGFEGRHIESSFDFCTEITVEDIEGNKYSGYQWASNPKFKDYDPYQITENALADAVSQIGPRDIESGRKKVVVHAKASSRLFGPLIQALDGNAIQQKFSFMDGSMGQKLFPDNLNVTDMARSIGKPGSRLFDTEGSATADGPIIEDGVVKKYFVNSYCAAKTGMQATVEGPSRPCIMPFICKSAEKEINLTDILAHCGSGILVTGFNGGNCNQATGNFSFGIEGFVFENGRIAYPFNEALMTGNMLELWNSIIAAGSDPRAHTRWQIPTLAFENVEINA